MANRETLDLDFVRSWFPPLENGWTYMENAGGSYLPTQVIERVTAYMRETQMQPGWAFAPSRLANERLTSAQHAIAAMINAEPDEILVGPSTTLNVYVLAQGLRHLFAPGDAVVVTNQDHEANGGAWRRLADLGVEVRQWSIDPESGDLDPADLERLLDARVRLVCFPHCSNVVGSLNDVAAITAIAHDAGAMVCVDGVAYAAHRAIDVKGWEVDFYLLSLYKLYGPHLALLYGKREKIALASNQNHFFHDQKQPETLHPGGLNYESVAGLQGIADYIEAVYDHHFEARGNDLTGRTRAVFELFAAQEEALATRLADYLAGKPQVRLIGRATGARDRRLPTFSFTVEGRPSKEIAEALMSHRIGVGHGHFYGYRCVEGLGIADPEDGVVRVSLVHYNTLEEVERLIAALEEIL